MAVDLYGPAPKVTRENFVEVLDEITRHPDVIAAHEKWERADEQWKQLVKEEASDTEQLLAAVKVRQAREEKDVVFDHVARLSEDIAWQVGVIEDYTLDTIGKCTAIDDVEELSVAWHNLRRQGLGGSSLSKFLGLHWMSKPGALEYMTDWETDLAWSDAAVEKSHEVYSAWVPDHGVLYRGHCVEPALIARYAIVHDKRVAVSKATWRGESEYQVINLDGIILDDDGNPEGVLECKTSSRDWTWQWGVPVHYRVQVLWYLRALGFKYADVAVRFDSGVFGVYRIYANETIDGTDNTRTIEQCVPELEERWEHLRYMVDNPEKLWEENLKLNEEYEYEIRDFDIGVSLKKNDKRMLAQSSVVQITTVAPYDRMDERFTVPVMIKVSRVGEKTKTYVNRKVQPLFYPYFDVPDDAEEYIDAKKLLSDVAAHGAIYALDTPTVAALEDLFTHESTLYHETGSEKESLLHLSALRRAVDMIPNGEDFKDAQEFFAWLGVKGEE